MSENESTVVNISWQGQIVSFCSTDEIIPDEPIIVSRENYEHGSPRSDQHDLLG